LPPLPPLPAAAPPPPPDAPAPPEERLPPWVALAYELLDGLPPAGLLFWPIHQPLPASLAHLPPPLLRLRAALASLPPPADLAPQQLRPGPWCLSLPLWGNPFLVSAAHPAGLDHAFTDFLAAGVGTLGRALAVERAVAAAPTQAAYVSLVRHPLLASSPAFAQRHVAAERLAALLAAVPAAWVAAARAAAAAAAPPRPPSPAHVLHTLLLPRLAWRLPAGRTVSFARLTVRTATALLAAPAAQQRASLRLAPFASLATAGSPPSPSHLPELQAAMRRLWRLPWENGRKEVFWRLAYDALPTAARLHRDQPCECGAGPRPDRRHHFWACPVAQAVVAAVQAALAAAAPTPPQSSLSPLCRPTSGWPAPRPASTPGFGGWSAWRLSKPWTVAGVLAQLQQQQPRLVQRSLDGFLQQPQPPEPCGAAASAAASQEPLPPASTRAGGALSAAAPYPHKPPPRRLPLGGWCVLVPAC
jgi:hypothetical protein